MEHTEISRCKHSISYRWNIIWWWHKQIEWSNVSILSLLFLFFHFVICFICISSCSRRRIVKAPVPPSAVVISAHELLRIKNESIIKTEADLAEEREQAMRAREEKERKARDRIARMKELEKRAAQLSKKSDEEIAAEARKQAIRDAAGKQRDQNSDVVKMLNSMAQRAAAYSIRDQQLEEKHRLAEIEKQIEKRQDLLVEVNIFYF